MEWDSEEDPHIRWSLAGELSPGRRDIVVVVSRPMNTKPDYAQTFAVETRDGVELPVSFLQASVLIPQLERGIVLELTGSLVTKSSYYSKIFGTETMIELRRGTSKVTIISNAPFTLSPIPRAIPHLQDVPRNGFFNHGDVGPLLMKVNGEPVVDKYGTARTKFTVEDLLGDTADLMIASKYAAPLEQLARDGKRAILRGVSATTAKETLSIRGYFTTYPIVEKEEEVRDADYISASLSTLEEGAHIKLDCMCVSRPHLNKMNVADGSKTKDGKLLLMAVEFRGPLSFGKYDTLRLRGRVEKRDSLTLVDALVELLPDGVTIPMDAIRGDFYFL